MYQIEALQRALIDLMLNAFLKGFVSDTLFALYSLFGCRLRAMKHSNVRRKRLGIMF